MRYISHDFKFEDIKQLVFSFEFLLSRQKVHNKEFNRGNSNPLIMNHGPLNPAFFIRFVFCVVCGVDFLGL